MEEINLNKNIGYFLKVLYGCKSNFWWIRVEENLLEIFQDVNTQILIWVGKIK